MASATLALQRLAYKLPLFEPAAAAACSLQQRTLDSETLAGVSPSLFAQKLNSRTQQPKSLLSSRSSRSNRSSRLRGSKGSKGSRPNADGENN